MTTLWEVITGIPKIYEQPMVTALKRITRRPKPRLKDKSPDTFLWPAIGGDPLPTPNEPGWFY